MAGKSPNVAGTRAQIVIGQFQKVRHVTYYFSGCTIIIFIASWYIFGCFWEHIANSGLELQYTLDFKHRKEIIPGESGAANCSAINS